MSRFLALHLADRATHARPSRRARNAARAVLRDHRHAGASAAHGERPDVDRPDPAELVRRRLASAIVAGEGRT